jgi:hypothetical protein
MLSCINSGELEGASGWVAATATNGGEAANRANGGGGSGPSLTVTVGELHRQQQRWWRGVSHVNGGRAHDCVAHCGALATL